MTVDFGTDLDFLSGDLSPIGGTISGFDIIAQAILIRLSTPLGGVIDAPDDGLSLTDYLSRGMTPGNVAALEGDIETQLVRDERIQSAKATVTLGTDRTMTVDLSVDTAAGPFSLTLGVSDAGVKILGGA